METPAPLSLEAAYRALDPQGALEPGAAAYAARPVRPLATLTTQLRLDHRPGLHLVSGHIGAGKTTELRRVEAELRPTTEARFFALDAISPEGKLSTAEIAAAVLVAVESMSARAALIAMAAERRLGRSDPNKSMVRAMAKKSAATDAMASRAITATLAEMLAATPAAGEDAEAEQRLVEILRTALEHEATESPEKPLIVLLDGLDKLSLNEIEVTLARILSWKLPVSLVATVPLSYLFTPSFSRREGGFSGVHIVPALPVVRRDLSANTESIVWFSNALANRNVRHLFDDNAVELIALMTAGIIRDFVRSCREAVLAALVQGRPRVDLEMATIALDDFALRMSRPVSGDDLRVLNVVAETGRVVGHSTFLALIDGGQIVEYRNGANWYAVHPLLRDIVARFAQEIAS